jgi:DNA-binding transcriptional LysR family regulator
MLRFLESGAAPAVAQEAITKQTTLAFVEAGLGWALIPASVRRKNARSGVVFRELGIGLPDVVTSAVRLKNSGSAAAVNFLTAVRQTARPAAA